MQWQDLDDQAILKADIGGKSSAMSRGQRSLRNYNYRRQTTSVPPIQPLNDNMNRYRWHGRRFSSFKVVFGMFLIVRMFRVYVWHDHHLVYAHLQASDEPWQHLTRAVVWQLTFPSATFVMGIYWCMSSTQCSGLSFCSITYFYLFFPLASRRQAHSARFIWWRWKYSLLYFQQRFWCWVMRRLPIC